MANTYKNIVITPSIGNNTVDPKIQFSGGNTTANTDINLFVYPTTNGTLSFEGSAGQLFSITNDLSNLIFSVADVSGIPSMEVYANGLVAIAKISGNVGIGNSTPSHKLSVNGAVSFGNSTIVGFVNATTTLAAGNTTITGFANVSGNGQFSGNVGIGVAPASTVGLYTIKSFNSDSTLFGQVNDITDANTSMTSARGRYGSYTILVNQNQNKSSDGLTTYNSNYFASLNHAYNGSTTTGGDALASALWGSVNRAYQYANGANANTVSDARGSASEVYQYGSGVISTAFGSVSQVIAGNSSVTGNITTAYGSYSGVVSNTASTIGTGYLYYGTHLGATTTTKWGIYLTGETQNYLSGNVGIGNTAPAHKLRVTGTTSLAGAVTDITTLAAGNTTITGFLNVSSTGQFGGAVSGITTLAAGNTTITGFVNATTNVSTNTAYATNSFNVGTAFTANSTVVNAVSYNIGTRIIANGTVTNATHLNGVIDTNYARTDIAEAFNGVVTFNANSVITKLLSANASFGTTAGQFLRTGVTTNTYWGSLLSADVTGALGYTPYNSTNPSGYVTSSGVTSITIGTGLSSTQSPLTTSGTLSVNSTYLSTLYLGISGTAADSTLFGGLGTGSYAKLAQNEIFSNGLRVQGQGLGVGAGIAAGTEGTITASGDITAFSSDSRLKTNIKTISDALEKVKRVRGITYDHNDLAASYGFEQKYRMAGVLAQEIEEVLPEVVTIAPFDRTEPDENGNISSKSGENYKTVKYEKIVPLLIEAIKELSAQVDDLKKRLGD